jgi:outer membrane protein
MFNVDAAVFWSRSRKLIYPTLNVVGSAQQTYGSTTALTTYRVCRLGARPVHDPGHQGGTERDHPSGQGDARSRRIDLDVARDQTQQTMTQSWGARSGQGPDRATTTQVNASEIALNGVREEARVEPAHSLDAQRPAGTRQRPGFACHRSTRPGRGVLYAAGGGGRLSPEVLVLKCRSMTRHYHQVRDTWGRAHARRK